MAPSKKREKDTSTSVAVAATTPAAVLNSNGSAASNGSVVGNASSNGNGGGVSSAATAATAACAVNAQTTSTGNGGGGSVGDNAKMNGHQQEQELFLQAFEKPTQIYRFLRNRHGTSPIFLNRTLSYMKDRMSRNNKKRANFKVNSILQQITQKTENVSNKYLNIIYNGLFDKSNCGDQWWNAGDAVCVEATLYKITKSKRKDSTSDFQEMMSYSSDVVYNHHDGIEHYAALSIPVQSIRPLGDQHTIYKLLFRIKALPKKANDENNDENCETPCKRSKLNTKIFGCELIVFEKNICFIPEGDYEAALQELSSMSIKTFSPKKRTWETLPDNYIPLSMKFDVFNQFPTLKFRLTWSATEIPNSIDAKDLHLYGDFAGMPTAQQTNDKLSKSLTNGTGNVNTNEMPLSGNGVKQNTNQTNTANGNNANMNVNHNNNCVKENGNSGKMVPTTVKAEKIQIVYNFLYSNNTRQQTEYTQEVICPWCGLDCLRLYALLKHLKLCHARFNFTYQPAGNGARIDVTINDSYDGSYAGSPYDLAGPSGCSFARTCGPVRRTSVTNLLVCRPRRQKTCLDEFLVLDEDDLSNQRPYITGHNRLYHHTETCLPVHPKELDIDSEGESDPLWLRQKTIQMIDEFSDVNEGEKELMKLWNLHVMKHGYVGDCQLPLACEMFLDANGHEVIRKNLYRNFILHMSSLFDYGLVSAETLYKTVQKLQGMLSKYPEGQELMSKQREAQLKYWLDVGIHKQEEQKLKSPQKQAKQAHNNSNNNTAKSTNTADTDDKVGGGKQTSGGSNSKSAMDAKTMLPPTKRSATAVKRASMHPQNSTLNTSSSSSSEKSINSAGGAAAGAGAGSSGSKGVAKKTASQADDDDKEPPVVAHILANATNANTLSDKRERRSDSGAAGGGGIVGGNSGGGITRRRSIAAATNVTAADQRGDAPKQERNKEAVVSERPQRGGGSSASSATNASSTTTANTTMAESRMQAAKRRLSIKDAPQPISKRNRTSEVGGGHAVGAATTKRTVTRQSSDGLTTAASGSGKSTSATGGGAGVAGGGNLSATTTSALPKRLITRRQSIAGTVNMSNHNATEATTTPAHTPKSSAAAANSNNTITHHSLRTRLSVPLTKIDKR